MSSAFAGGHPLHRLQGSGVPAPAERARRTCVKHLWPVKLHSVISVTAKVGQKYALDKIAGNTRTLGTKSWPP